MNGRVLRASLRAVVALAIAAVSCAPLPASATTQAELRSRLDSLQGRAQAVGRAYDRAYSALDVSDGKLNRIGIRLAATKKRLGRVRLALNKRAAGIYRGRSIDMLDVVLGATSFEDLETRLNYAQRLGQADADAIHAYKTLSAELRADRSELEATRRDQAAAVAAYQHQRDKLLGKLNSMKAEYAALTAELNAARAHGDMASGVIAAPGPNGMVFPVRGPHYYADTWGAARSGGRHHMGTDIMSPRGTPVVATVSGSVTIRDGGLGGKAIFLSGAGWEFYYAHLNSWAVRGGHVSAGQVIGYVGNTGNAAGGPCHLHFQMGPGGRWVDPYPYLRAME